MLKKILIISGVVLIAIILFFNWFKKDTKKHSPADVATYQNQDLTITINYCRPYAKSRVIFGEESAGALQPYGKYWRVGANEATTFELNKSILFNDKTLEPGKYSLYAYPGKESWTVCINSDYERWGAQEADKDKDILRTMVHPNNDAPFLEQFLISFDPADSLGSTYMNIHWDKTLVKVPIKKL
ncbi:MAG: DUF2911 domain-containing protein [Bacteroidota bacterium]|nr:DUF2911 domain-containing protein [Bacteroidota bacterium]